MSVIRDFTRGLRDENPVFRLVLGLCPTLAVSTGLEGGFWMGVAVVFVLFSSNIIISALKGIIPPWVRIPSFVTIIAAFVTVVQMLMHAFLPATFRVLGLFIPLIVVNCIILGRAEAFASKRPVINAAADGLGMGAGFLLALVVIGAIRELLGTGNLKVAGAALLGAGVLRQPALIALLPPGAFLTLGVLLGVLNHLTRQGRGTAAQHMGFCTGGHCADQGAGGTGAAGGGGAGAAGGDGVPAAGCGAGGAGGRCGWR